MRIDELNRVSRRPVPPRELPDDVRSGDFELDDKQKTDELLRELMPLFNEFAKKWGLDSLTSFGKFRNTRPQDLSLAYVERMYMPEKDIQTFRDNWPAMSKELSALLKKRDAFRRIVDLRAAKKGAHRGVNPQDAKKLLDIIRLMTKKSYQRLDARAIPLLQKMTVVPARLPKYVYRGIFFDGAKIVPGALQGWDTSETAQIESWKKKWAPGSFPKAKPGKATSWSTSMDTAIEFMEAQDNVKDQGNGFHVLIRYDISKEPGVVAADLRSIPENGFWNQQEILLTKEAVNYEVVQVFENNSPEYKTFRDTSKHANWTSGAVGFNYAEVVMADFFTPDKHDAALVEKWRTFKDMTVAQVADKIGAKEQFRGYPPTLLFPFAALARRTHINIRKEQLRSGEMTASYSIYLHGQLLDRVQAIAPETTIRGGSLFATIQVSLVSNVYNSFEFNIEVTDVRFKNNQGEMTSVPALTAIAKEETELRIRESCEGMRRVRLNFR